MARVTHVSNINTPGARLLLCLLYHPSDYYISGTAVTYYMSVRARQSYVSYMFINLLVIDKIYDSVASRGLTHEIFDTLTQEDKYRMHVIVDLSEG